MNLNDLFTEEKVRLDPKCWTGKKIGNPKTKMKGGTRVNNCVPAESVNEMDKSQTPPGRDGRNDSDAGKKEYTAKATTAKKVAKDAEKILNKELNKKQGVAEGSLEEIDRRGFLKGAGAAAVAGAAGGADAITADEKYGVNFTDAEYNAFIAGLELYYFIKKGELGEISQVALPPLQKAIGRIVALPKGKERVNKSYSFVKEYLDEYEIKNPKVYQDKLNWRKQNYQKIIRDIQALIEFGESVNQGVAEEYELAGVGVAYELGRRAYKQGMTIRDNPYSATREARKNDEWAKGLERGKHDANDARHFRNSVKEQGVAEAGDSIFVGFMNKTLADKVDAPKADPMAGAPDFYRNAAVATLDGRKGFKNALKFGLKALSRLDPETRQQLAAGSEQAVANYLTDVAERSGQMGDDTFVEEDISEVQDYLSDVFHDPSINSWKDVLQQSRRMSESQLDEKSVSQAQFRTMAAAAHNPEFAKKVGIKQSVAKEFNQADKGNNYKKLPDRTNEEGERGRGRPMAGDWDPTAGKVGRVEKTPTGVRHHADPSRYGGTEQEPELDALNKNTINAMDRALGVKWDRESKKYFSPLKVDMDEGEQQKGADYRDPPEADYGDDYQDMVARVKKLAGLGPLKTVYDPAKRQYRNMPTAVQPKK